MLFYFIGKILLGVCGGVRFQTFIVFIEYPIYQLHAMTGKLWKMIASASVKSIRTLLIE